MAQFLKLSRSSSLVMNFMRTNARTFCAPAKPPASSQAAAAASDAHVDPTTKGTHRVDSFEKKLLVWTGKYKSAEEVPAYVSQEKVDRARNKFRIRVANIMMALTLLGCALMIYSGRHAVERGDSVLKMNQEWHREYNEKAQKEAQEAAAAHKKSQH